MKQVKKRVPQAIKFPMWFVFKSPQRRLGWYTLWLDVVGLMGWMFFSIWPFVGKKPVSICVGISNRSRLLLDKFIPGLNEVKDKHLVELSVFDCGSTDVPQLEAEIRKLWKGKLVFRSEPVAFARAHTFNRAVTQSHHPIVFICDGDFSVPRNIVSLCNRYTQGRMVWFPIVFYLYKNKPEFYSPANGEWMQWGGKGILATKRLHFEQVGMLNEKFVTWGQEDDELWERYYQNRYWICRSRCRHLLHHWHPSHNPRYRLLEEMADKNLL